MSESNSGNKQVSLKVIGGIIAIILALIPFLVPSLLESCQRNPESVAQQEKPADPVTVEKDDPPPISTVKTTPVRTKPNPKPQRITLSEKGTWEFDGIKIYAKDLNSKEQTFNIIINDVKCRFESCNFPCSCIGYDDKYNVIVERIFDEDEGETQKIGLVVEHADPNG